ncbi:MAG: two-component regulator propeller domain-containing protein [Bacteroidia bacterium]
MNKISLLNLCQGKKYAADALTEVATYYIAFLLFLIIPFCLNAQDAGIRSWSVSEGLAQSQVYCMLEDSRGFLWFGTQGGGLSRFDGKRFSNFHQRDGLVNDYILSLAETPDGNVWIGTRNGISCFDGEAFTKVQFADNQSVAVNDLHCDQAGTLWAATNVGLFQIVEKVALPEPTTEGIDFSRVRMHPDGSLWLGSGKQGVFILKNDSLFKDLPQLKGIRGRNISDIAFAQNGAIWISTYDSGLFLGDENGFRRFRPVAAFPRTLIFDIELEGEDAIWLATQNAGVWSWRFRDSSLSHFGEAEGLADDHVRSLLIDSWANLWMGTSGGGVSRSQGQSFAHYGRRQGLHEQVYAITEDADCRLWLGNADRGIAVLQNDSLAYLTPAPLRNTKVKSILSGQAGNIWVGTEGNGLGRFNDATWSWYNTANGLGGNWVRSIVEDKSGNIFVGKAGGGLSQLTPDSTWNRFEILRYRKGDFNWANRINTLAFDRSDRLWLGTYSRGMGYLAADSTLVQIEVPGGPTAKLVRTLICGPKGFIWAGTAAGIIRINPNIEETQKAKLISDKLYSQNVYSLVFDEAGNLWVGTESGLDQVILNDAGDCIESKHFSAAEGFTGIENCQGAALRDRDGKLWFGTIGGLTAYTPGTMNTNPVPPRISLTGVQLFYAPIGNTSYADFADRNLGIGSNLELRPNDNHLSFTFIGINHSNPEAVRYSWRMLGAERDWSPATDRSQATYSQLPPGEYRFQVRASNEDGVWSKPISTPPFIVSPPLIKRPWFQLLAGSILALLIIGGIVLYIRRLRQNARQAQERLLLEKRLIELEQKALQLQMNPHFIFHALNGIQGLIQQESPEMARKHLGRFSTLMRRVLQHARQGTISLEEEIEALEDYLAIEHMSRGESFDFRIEASDDIEADFVEIPPMMLQPLIENALIHGLAGLDGRRGKLEVEFSMKSDDVLLVRVQDNGRGRAAAAAASGSGRDGHISTALNVTRERLAALGPEGELLFEDLTDANGNAVGTAVHVSIPLA